MFSDTRYTDYFTVTCYHIVVHQAPGYEEYGDPFSSVLELERLLIAIWIWHLSNDQCEIRQ